MGFLVIWFNFDDGKTVSIKPISTISRKKRKKIRCTLSERGWLNQNRSNSAVDRFQTRLRSDEKYTHRSKG